MAIQNSINQGIGALGSALAVNEHLKQEKKANTLSTINEKEKYIQEYVDTNEAIKKNVEEANLANKELENIDTDLKKVESGEKKFLQDYKTGKIVNKDTYMKLADMRREEVNQKLQANEYEANMLRARMAVQDERAKVLKVDKHSPDIQALNSEEDKQMVREFRKGGNK